MGKIATYLALLSTTILLFHFAGLIGDTPISFLLTAILNPQNLKTYSFTVQATAILGAFAAGTAIVIGTLAPQRFEAAVTIAFTDLLVVIGWDMISMFSIVSSRLNTPIAALIISPLLLIYILSAIEWWRGKD